MTTYTVRLAERAVENIESYREFIATKRYAPESAQRWVNKVFQTIESLERFPRRCPLAPDNRFTTYEVRMRVVGQYLILFHIDEQSNTVHVLGFRHGRRRPQADDLLDDPHK